MTVPITTIVTNRIGKRQKFKPLPSAKRALASLQSYYQKFVADAAPEVISNERAIPNAPGWFDETAPANMYQVIQVAFPIPTACGVLLGAWAPTIDRFRYPARFSARKRTNGGINLEEGRYIIEWGQGQARNYVFADLAPGSLQIPACQFLNVFAHVRNDADAEGTIEAVAGATVYPNLVLPQPNCYYSIVVQIFAADYTYQERVAPFARQLSGHASGNVGNPAQNALIQLRDVSGLVTVAQYLIPIPVVGNTYTQPHPCTHVAMPGGSFFIRTGSLGSGPGGIMSSISVQTIRL